MIKGLAITPPILGRISIGNMSFKIDLNIRMNHGYFMIMFVFKKYIC